MNIEIDFKIQVNKLRLKRYLRFNWKYYFLKTFAFLLLIDLENTLNIRYDLILISKITFK